VNLGYLIERASRRYADRVALRNDSQSLTFAQVGDRVGRLARALREAGLNPGDRVLDLQRNSITYVETDLALASAGLCRVALNYRQSPQDWAKVVADCTPRAIIYAPEFSAAAAELRAGLEIAICTEAGADDESMAHFAARATSDRTILDFDADVLVSLNYSSGTSGQPKGAKRTHRNRLASTYNSLCDVYQGLPAADDVWCHAGPMTHASGLLVLPTYAFGGQQVVLTGFDPAEFLDTVTRFKVTGSVLVPTMIARLLAHGVVDGQLAGMRRLLYAGAPMAADQVRAAYHQLTPNLVNMYGMVEAVPPVSILNQEEHRIAIETGTDWLASAGTVCTGVAIDIRDDDGVRQPDGELGEVFVSGDNVMGGYWGLEESSDVKGVEAGWLRTGDVGYLSGGRLYLVDRKGDMIITGGYNVYPSEVEKAVRAVPGVTEAVVFGSADVEWGQVVTCVYTGSPDLQQAIEDYCRSHLAGYKKPRVIQHVEEFPVNHNGKVSRKDVANLLARISAN
jgi:acyl-CoA synthetase (AMP-forming)/AMP-acid ligase II